MSIDLSVIFSHPFDNSTIVSLPQQLNADNGPFRDAMTRYEMFVNNNHGGKNTIKHLEWEWSISEDKWVGTEPEVIWAENTPDMMLCGPAITIINFGRVTCKASMFPRWHTFQTDAEWRHETRRACYALSQIFQSNRAIYYPDSSWKVSRITDFLFENYTFEQIEIWLREKIGQPADTIESINALERANQNANGYYFLDDFADLHE